MHWPYLHHHPNSVTYIGYYAFQGCSALTSVAIGNSVTYIGEYAFRYCFSLTSVTLNSNAIASEGYDFTYNLWNIFGSQVTEYNIGDDVTSIGSYAFYSCTGLISVTIPNSVTSIGSSAFMYCSGLTSVTIGSGIKSIRTQAFAKCSELTDVYCLAENVPNTNSDAFSESYIDYATLHVPDASVDSYKATAPWSGFKVVVGLNGETPDEPEKCATPTISYQDGKLTFTCATEGAEFVSEITDADIKKHYDASISLTATYNISVFAMKTGYDNSDVATATLVWLTGNLNADDVPTKVGAMRAQPVLIKRMDGRLIIEGADAGTPCYVYTTDGRLVKEGTTTSSPLTLELPTGCIYILKVGTKTLKVAL